MCPSLLSTFRCLGKRYIISIGNKHALFSKRTDHSIHLSATHPIFCGHYSIDIQDRISYTISAKKEILIKNRLIRSLMDI